MINFAGKNFVNLRLDKFLCAEFDIGFGVAQKLVREKKVKINGIKCDPSYKIKQSDKIEISIELKKRLHKQTRKPVISKEKAGSFLQSIIYQDENIVVIDKPSGLATQGGTGVDISVNNLIPYLKNYSNATDPQLVHRLDKDTSGLLIIAKNKEAASLLTEYFHQKMIRKTYLALVCGIVNKDYGIINIPLRKKFVGKNEKVYPDFEEGKEAITNFKVLKTFSNYSLLELNPVTGRTHQLRVHCKEIGHPIINDIKYGGVAVFNKKVSNRLCLHAHKIEIDDYFGKNLSIETKLPDFLEKIAN